jgi:hypothetical protein
LWPTGKIVRTCNDRQEAVPQGWGVGFWVQGGDVLAVGRGGALARSFVWCSWGLGPGFWVQLLGPAFGSESGFRAAASNPWHVWVAGSMLQHNAMSVWYDVSYQEAATHLHRRVSPLQLRWPHAACPLSHHLLHKAHSTQQHLTQHTGVQVQAGTVCNSSSSMAVRWRRQQQHGSRAAGQQGSSSMAE